MEYKFDTGQVERELSMIASAVVSAELPHLPNKLHRQVENLLMQRLCDTLAAWVMLDAEEIKTDGLIVTAYRLAAQVAA